MGIGSSSGAHFTDDFHRAVGHDNNVIDPDTTPDLGTNDNNIEEEVPKNGPMAIADKMPFPNNHNPDSDFNTRFGNLPPSGIMNDLKKPDGNSPPLLRRVMNLTNTPDEIMGAMEGGDFAHSYQRGIPQPGMGKAPAEKVKSAALSFNGEVFEGENHGYALGKIWDKYGQGIDHAKVADGFTTTKGRFVSREEAFGLAKSNDQIQEKVLQSLTPDSSMLLSEDLK